MSLTMLDDKVNSCCMLIWMIVLLRLVTTGHWLIDANGHSNWPPSARSCFFICACMHHHLIVLYDAQYWVGQSWVCLLHTKHLYESTFKYKHQHHQICQSYPTNKYGPSTVWLVGRSVGRLATPVVVTKVSHSMIVLKRVISCYGVEYNEPKCGPSLCSRHFGHVSPLSRLTNGSLLFFYHWLVGMACECQFTSMALPDLRNRGRERERERDGEAGSWKCRNAAPSSSIHSHCGATPNLRPAAQCSASKLSLSLTCPHLPEQQARIEFHTCLRHVSHSSFSHSHTHILSHSLPLPLFFSISHSPRPLLWCSSVDCWEKNGPKESWSRVQE